MVVEDKNEAKAGQFYMLKHNGATLLPRPISVCETRWRYNNFCICSSRSRN